MFILFCRLLLAMPIEVEYAGLNKSGTYQMVIDNCLVVSTNSGDIGIPIKMVEKISFDNIEYQRVLLHDWLTLENLKSKEIIDKSLYWKKKKRLHTLYTAIEPAIGYGMEHERPQTIGAATFDGVLIGGLAYGIWGVESWGIILPFTISLISFRIWAVKDIQTGYSTLYIDRLRAKNLCAVH
jgi:hypothetical protein